MPVNPEAVRKQVEESRNGVRIRVYVKPEQPRTMLVLEEDELVFYTEEPPVQGRANASLIRFLSRVFNVSPGMVRIVRGQRDRLKIVEVEGVDVERAVELLAEAAEPW